MPGRRPGFTPETEPSRHCVRVPGSTAVSRAATVCATPGCPHLDPCPTHRGGRLGGPDRPPAARRGYGSAWRRRRTEYLAGHPLCEWPGCAEPGIDVHHLDGAGPAGDNSDANLEALCHPHHSVKTSHDRRGWR